VPLRGRRRRVDRPSEKKKTRQIASVVGMTTAQEGKRTDEEEPEKKAYLQKTDVTLGGKKE